MTRAQGEYYTECLSTPSLDPLAGDLSAVEARESGFGDGVGLLDLSVGGGEDDLDVARVALVGVDAAVGTVRAAAGFLKRKGKSQDVRKFGDRRLEPHDVRGPAEHRCS